MNTVLLIEDDRNCARMVSKILEAQGYSVHHAPNALSGLRLARQIRPDLILVDMDLPDLEGKIVVSKLRGETTSVLPIIAFTADDSVKARRLALAFGCSDFIAKPIDTRIFPQLIGNMLQQAKGQAVDATQAHSLH